MLWVALIWMHNKAPLWWHFCFAIHDNYRFKNLWCNFLTGFSASGSGGVVAC